MDGSFLASSAAWTPRGASGDVDCAFACLYDVVVSLTQAVCTLYLRLNLSSHDCEIIEGGST